MHGVAQALVPGITGWVDSGFAMPNSPLDMWKGQWKGGGNFLSHTVEGMVNSGPLGKLVHLATGYRLDLPSFDIPAQQQMGAAAFDTGMITLSVMAPEARLPALNGAGRVANSPATITAYRVEGNIAPNHRLLISETGEASIVPGNDNVIWLNFGQESRAMSYLQRKIDAGLPGAQLKSFEVDAALVERLRVDAVPERLARMNPNKPIISADPYPDQFGLPKSYFEDLLNSVKPGTGKNGH